MAAICLFFLLSTMYSLRCSFFLTASPNPSFEVGSAFHQIYCPLMAQSPIHGTFFHALLIGIPAVCRDPPPSCPSSVPLFFGQNHFPDSDHYAQISFFSLRVVLLLPFPSRAFPFFFRQEIARLRFLSFRGVFPALVQYPSLLKSTPPALSVFKLRAFSFGSQRPLILPSKAHRPALSFSPEMYSLVLKLVSIRTPLAIRCPCHSSFRNVSLPPKSSFFPKFARLRRNRLFSPYSRSSPPGSLEFSAPPPEWQRVLGYGYYVSH